MKPRLVLAVCAIGFAACLALAACMFVANSWVAALPGCVAAFWNAAIGVRVWRSRLSARSA